MDTLSPKYSKGSLDKLVDEFLDFFSNEVSDDIILESGSAGLDIQYSEVEDWNSSVAEHILTDPDELIPTMTEALRQYSEQMGVEDTEELSVRISSSPRRKQIRHIRESHCNTLLEIDGVVTKSTDVVPKLGVAAFRCDNCGTHTRTPQPLWGEIDKPTFCTSSECDGSKGSFGRREENISVAQSETVDFQKLRINEPHEQLKGSETPTSLDLGVRGNLTGCVEPGDKVTVVGVPRKRMRDDSSGMFDIYVEAQNIVVDNEEFEEIVPTEQEIEEIERLSDQPDVFDRLSQSISPGIKGWDTQKEAVMYQLFGGVRKQTPNGSKKRGDIHVLLIGDPGLGKSEILEYANRISPRGVSSTGKGSSSAGLTAAVVKSGDFSKTEQWSLQAGTMVLADKGIAAIDELDKMSQEDRSSMHESMEQQTVTVAKAGINATLQSRCSVLGAANPEDGRFREFDSSISDQIDLNPALISRFDLIFTMVDNMSREEDGEIAEHIIETNYVAQKNESDAVDNTDNESEDVNPPVSPDLFRKYIAYARRNYNPVVTDEAKEEIKEFYVDMRESADDPDVIPVTARKIEAIIRLAESSARIRLSNKITKEDALRAISTVKGSLRDVGYNEELGEFDADKIESNQSYSQYNRVSSIEAVIKDHTEENEGIKVSEITDILSHKYDESIVEREIDKLLSKGEIMYSDRPESKVRLV